MKKMIAAVALAAACAVPVESQALNVFTGYGDTHVYRTLNAESRLAYVTGVIDGFYAAPLMANADVPKTKRLSDCLIGNKVNNQQAMAIVDKYLENDPTTWSMPLNMNVLNALNAACNKLGTPLR